MRNILKLVISLLFVFMAGCKNDDNNINVKLENSPDNDIVLINIGEANREQIAELLIAIDSCKPAIIAVDAIFQEKKDKNQDTLLEKSFKIISNDVIIYMFDSLGIPKFSMQDIRESVTGEGYANAEKRGGLSSYFTPLSETGGELYKSFALTIVNLWKPEFRPKIKANKSIPIKFSRTLSQYTTVHMEDFNTKSICDSIKGKVALVGFIGPGNEDKHFTPLRFTGSYKDEEPDTYGLVIIANEIRTILDNEK